MQFVLYSLMINMKNSFINQEIEDYSPILQILSTLLLFHNIFAAYYTYSMFHFYVSLSLKNMHSVEDTIISGLYQRAQELCIPIPGDTKIFYYTRDNYYRNWCEMMGTANFVRWVIPVPYLGRQNHQLQSADTREIQYMRLDRDACRNLVMLEYQVENYFSCKSAAANYQTTYQSYPQNSRLCSPVGEEVSGTSTSSSWQPPPFRELNLPPHLEDFLLSNSSEGEDVGRGNLHEHY